MTGSNFTPWTTCPYCGKRSYATRKAGKQADRRHGKGEKMNVYECRHGRGWHIGHLHKGIKQGRWTRADLGGAA